MPPLNADERTTLESWLDFHRATLAMKCEGLDDEQAAAASVPPSGLTLTGLIQHMAEVERNWFRRVLPQNRSSRSTAGKLIRVIGVALSDVTVTAGSAQFPVLTSRLALKVTEAGAVPVFRITG